MPDLCPHCKIALEPAGIDPDNASECPKCQRIFSVDAERQPAIARRAAAPRKASEPINVSPTIVLLVCNLLLTLVIAILVVRWELRSQSAERDMQRAIRQIQEAWSVFDSPRSR